MEIVVLVLNLWIVNDPNRTYLMCFIFPDLQLHEIRDITRVMQKMWFLVSFSVILQKADFTFEMTLDYWVIVERRPKPNEVGSSSIPSFEILSTWWKISHVATCLMFSTK